MDNNSISFKFDEDKELVLSSPEGVFTPTGTTDGIVQGVAEYISKPGKLLDLGCGIGVVGLALYQLGLVEGALYASDLGEKAIEATIANAKTYGCDVVARSGSIFAPWAGEKVDYIVNDISGIAEQVSVLSPWFRGVSCEAGVDGTALVEKVLKEASSYLNEGGAVFFPAISFSAVDKILAIANANFTSVERLLHSEWPLPSDMVEHIPVLRELQEKNLIQFSEKFGMVLCFTDVYVAYN